jgi:threonine synthase
VARWLPQMLYYFAAYQNLRKLGDSRTPVFSVPSGNFGNICAGMMAKEIGLPLERFIAATNINDTVVRYLNNKVYEPKPTTPTLSNAMDVSDPSNFIRIEELFKKQDLERVIKAYRFDDSQTLEAMRYLFKEYEYVADPHGAIGYLGLETDPIDSSSEVGIFLETAHPVKFDGAVKKAIDKDVVEPESVKRLRSLEKVSKKIESYTDLKDLLSSN